MGSVTSDQRPDTTPAQEVIAALTASLAKDPASVEALAAAAIGQHGPVPRLLRLRAAALRQLGRTDEANRLELESIRTSRHDPALSKAAQLLMAGQRLDAHQLLEGVLTDDVDDPVANLMLGGSIGQSGHFRRGEALLRRAIDAAPGYLEARARLANLLLLQSRPREALDMIDSAIVQATPPPAILRLKASILSEMGNHLDAAAIYRDLLRRNPREVADWLSLGDCLRTVGNTAASEQAYRSAVKRNPNFGRSWWSLASLKATPFSPDDVKLMETAIKITAADADNVTYTHFALATAYEQKGDHAKAFDHFDVGNRLCRALRNYDPRIVTREIARSERALTPELFQRFRSIGNPSGAPIFVIGMPRSGSTLVEQILASHPLIEGTAELPIIPILIQTWLTDRGATPDMSYRDLLGSMTPAESRQLGDEYLARAEAYRKTDRPFFVDKLPHNWADIGFIKAILPQAHIIDVRRAPMDCCFSNYRLMFAQGHPASYSLEEMAQYYRDYLRLMRHVDRVAPGLVHHIIYERLVDDLEATTRRLLDDIGVAFDPACLEFHATQRAVATASSEQVRKPLNRSGIGAYKPYEAFLGPLREALGEIVDQYAD